MGANWERAIDVLLPAMLKSVNHKYGVIKRLESLRLDFGRGKEQQAG